MDHNFWCPDQCKLILTRNEDFKIMPRIIIVVVVKVIIKSMNFKKSFIYLAF